MCPCFDDASTASGGDSSSYYSTYGQQDTYGQQADYGEGSRAVAPDMGSIGRSGSYTQDFATYGQEYAAPQPGMCVFERKELHIPFRYAYIQVWARFCIFHMCASLWILDHSLVFVSSARIFHAWRECDSPLSLCVRVTLTQS